MSSTISIQDLPSQVRELISVPPFSTQGVTGGKNFTSATVSRSTPYVKRVKKFAIHNPRGTGKYVVHGSIRGTHTYKTRIEIFPRGLTFGFDYYCSCPVGFRCKHAAALLQYFHEQSLSTSPKAESQQEVQLSGSTKVWLDRVNREHRKQSLQTNPTKKTSNLTLTYCLEKALFSAYNHDDWNFRLRPGAILKNGDIKPKSNEARVTPHKIPKYVQGADIQAALAYYAVSQRSWQGPNVSDSGIIPILEYALSSGRLYVLDDFGEYRPVIKGESTSVALAWKQFPTDKALIPILEFDQSPGAQPLYTDRPFALNLSTNPATLSEILPPYSTEMMKVWEEISEISEGEAQLLSHEIAKLSPSGEIPLPAELKTEKLPQASPKPKLRLRLARLDDHFEGPVIVGEVSFAYHNSPYTPYHPKGAPEVNWIKDNTKWISTRNQSQENQLHRQLRTDGIDTIAKILDSHTFEETQGQYLIHESEDLDDTDVWLPYLARHQVALEEAGWTIEINPATNLYLDNVSEFVSALEPSSEHDINWFEFTSTGTIGDQSISLIPLIAYCVDHDLLTVDPETLPDPLILPHPDQHLDNKGFIALPRDRFLDICHSVAHLFSGRDSDSDTDTPLTADTLAAASIAHTLDLRGSDTLKNLADLGKKLSSITSLPKSKPPASLDAELRPYQIDGFRWLKFLADHKLNGILADDMGLGKTVQTLAFLASLPRKKGTLPSLIVAPTSVITNWQSEAARFTPTLKTLLLQGPERKERFDEIPKFHLVLTSYPLLSRDQETLLDQSWNTVILDEAQHIKNPKTNAAKVAFQLECQHRFCLSGTPMENHLGELWSLMNFTMPGYLGDQKTFQSNVRRPIERDQDASTQYALNRRVAPLILRRTKDEVATDLPPKTELIHHINLSTKESDLYESVRATMDKRVREALANKGLSKSHIIILDALLKLRQICCHPSLLKTPAATKVKSGSKLDFLTQSLLPELLAEGRRILLFSQFTSVLALIEQQLKKDKIEHLKLTGQTKNRAALVKEFQEGTIPIFLISLKAGGTGLNLTAADTVIHYDPWWNPAAENQATDRAHRIGQTNPVFVHKLICQGAIEERILELQRKKAELVQSLLTQETGKLKIDQQTLSHLLSPLT